MNLSDAIVNNNSNKDLLKDILSSNSGLFQINAPMGCGKSYLIKALIESGYQANKAKLEDANDNSLFPEIDDDTVKSLQELMPSDKNIQFITTAPYRNCRFDLSSHKETLPKSSQPFFSTITGDTEQGKVTRLKMTSFFYPTMLLDFIERAYDHVSGGKLNSYHTQELVNHILDREYDKFRQELRKPNMSDSLDEELLSEDGFSKIDESISKFNRFTSSAWNKREAKRLKGKKTVYDFNRLSKEHVIWFPPKGTVFLHDEGDFAFTQASFRRPLWDDGEGSGRKAFTVLSAIFNWLSKHYVNIFLSASNTAQVIAELNRKPRAGRVKEETIELEDGTVIEGEEYSIIDFKMGSKTTGSTIIREIMFEDVTTSVRISNINFNSLSNIPKSHLMRYIIDKHHKLVTKGDKKGNSHTYFDEAQDKVRPLPTIIYSKMFKQEELQALGDYAEEHQDKALKILVIGRENNFKGMKSLFNDVNDRLDAKLFVRAMKELKEVDESQEESQEGLKGSSGKAKTYKWSMPDRDISYGIDYVYCDWIEQDLGTMIDGNDVFSHYDVVLVNMSSSRQASINTTYRYEDGTKAPNVNVHVIDNDITSSGLQVLGRFRKHPVIGHFWLRPTRKTFILDGKCGEYQWDVDTSSYEGAKRYFNHA